jgi:putative membrane protein
MTPAQSPSPRPDEASVRDHLANERTFLAWVRTAVTFIGLGFAVDQLLEPEAGGELLGLGLIVVGGALMLPALIGFRRTSSAIEHGDYAPAVVTNTLLGAVVLLAAIALAAYALLSGS